MRGRPEAATFGAAKPEGARPKKGMQLGKAKKANDFLDSLRAEGEVVEARTAKPMCMRHHAMSGWLGLAGH